MDRARKLELIQRSLGLRHKLKVHDSMKQSETHEDLSLSLLTRWELEDELNAIEELLGGARRVSVEEKKELIEDGILGRVKIKPGLNPGETADSAAARAKAAQKKKKKKG